MTTSKSNHNRRNRELWPELSIQGLTHHARCRLATRFGISSEQDAIAFTKRALGLEGKDWVPFNTRTIYWDQDPTIHGRQVRYEGETVYCVVKLDGKNGDRPVIITAMDDATVSPLKVFVGRTPPPTYLELKARVRELEHLEARLSSMEALYDEQEQELIELRKFRGKEKLLAVVESLREVFHD